MKRAILHGLIGGLIVVVLMSINWNFTARAGEPDPNEVNEPNTVTGLLDETLRLAHDMDRLWKVYRKWENPTMEVEGQTITIPNTAIKNTVFTKINQKRLRVKDIMVELPDAVKE